MVRVVAFCSDIQQFHRGRILDEAWCRRFPGTEWLPVFAKLLAPLGLRLTTGDVALQEIAAGSLAVSMVIIIAAEDSRHADQLLQLGAAGGMIICAESPLFARTFYERIAELGPRYFARILFQATIDSHFPQTPNTIQTRFPSFSRNLIEHNAPAWADRPLLVMVAGNKYWRTPFNPSFCLTPKKLEAWARGKFGLTQSSIKRLARASQLHDQRLRLIHHFGQRGMLSLYGSGWDQIYNLPGAWRGRLAPVLRRLKPAPCDDKKQTIAGFRFAFAIENITYPGYHTEKIIDCFAAGVIPIYLGDPLIKQSIPAESFINLADFPSPSSLGKYLEEFTPEQAEGMLNAGRNFLKKQGDAYSYEGFAENALAMLKPLLQSQAA
jgi:hypothetical protein